MSADRGVQAAREYLNTISARLVAELPPSVLVREDAELRRQLRIVLEVVSDYEYTVIDEDRTQPTMWGGIYVAAADALTVADALSDAADCGEQHEPIDSSAARSSVYRELAARLGSAR
jgi:hypothetical protein